MCLGLFQRWLGNCTHVKNASRMLLVASLANRYRVGSCLLFSHIAGPLSGQCWRELMAPSAAQ